MKPPHIDCARHVRDGAIDAMSALNDALREALAGLSPEEQIELNSAFGSIMGDICETLIHPAVSAFPELEPSEDVWAAVARARAKARSYAA